MRKQKIKTREYFRKNAAEWLANDEPSSMKTRTKEFVKIDGNRMSYFINGIEANGRIWMEQDVDLVMKNLQSNLFGR